VNKGSFRRDLYHRLNGFKIETPALRTCREDIPMLAEHFLELQKNRKYKPVSGFSRETLLAFQHYTWPGNVRELAHGVERAYIMTAAGVIQAAALPDGVSRERRQDVESDVSLLPDQFDVDHELSAMAWQMIRKVYEEEVQHGRHGVQKRVAVRVGLNPANGFTRKISEIKRACPELVPEIEELLARTLTGA